MTIETVTYISDFNTSYPASGDAKSEGDDHIRNIKSALKSTFPNVTAAVTSSHTDLNRVDGLTSDAVGVSDTQTLTNKTLTAPAITTPTITGTIETKVAVSSNAIDASAGNFFTKTVTGNITFTISNVPASGKAYVFWLELTNAGSYTIGFGSGFTAVKYEGGSQFSMTTSGVDLLGFVTYDGGANWYVLLLGRDLS